MIKHVGRHNNKKIVLLWRKVPNEDHMSLLVYSDTLPRLIHDELMKALESPIGQNAKELSEVLFRTTMADGRNALEVLHREGFIKKVPTSQVLITPTNKTSVRLDELNGILDEMDKGEEAIKRLADIDNEAGMAPKKRKKEGREVGMPPSSRSMSRTNQDLDATDSAAAYIKGALTDDDLAADRVRQAESMKKQAETLLAEAKRLESEAKEFSKAPKAGVAVVEKVTETKPARKPRVSKLTESAKVETQTTAVLTATKKTRARSAEHVVQEKKPQGSVPAQNVTTKTKKTKIAKKQED
jgi:hypothetical protein